MLCMYFLVSTYSYGNGDNDHTTTVKKKAKKNQQLGNVSNATKRKTIIPNYEFCY